MTHAWERKFVHCSVDARSVTFAMRFGMKHTPVRCAKNPMQNTHPLFLQLRNLTLRKKYLKAGRANNKKYPPRPTPQGAVWVIEKRFSLYNKSHHGCLPFVDDDKRGVALRGRNVCQHLQGATCYHKNCSAKRLTTKLHQKKISKEL